MMIICMLIPLLRDDIYDELRRYECIGGSLDDILALSLTTSTRRMSGGKGAGRSYHFWYDVQVGKCGWGRAPPLSRYGLILFVDGITHADLMQVSVIVRVWTDGGMCLYIPLSM